MAPGQARRACQRVRVLRQGSPLWRTVRRTDPRSSLTTSGVVVNAGIVLAVILDQRLGDRGARRPGGRARCSAGRIAAGAQGALADHAMLLGADCIDDCDVLRAGRTEAVLGHTRRWPLDAGPVPALVQLRARPRLGRVLGQALRRASGAGPGSGHGHRMHADNVRWRRERLKRPALSNHASSQSPRRRRRRWST
jgi:hypothetical protein